MTIFTLFKRKKNIQMNKIEKHVGCVNAMKCEKKNSAEDYFPWRQDISKRLSRCHRYYMIERKEFRVNVQYILTRNRCCVYITCIWICVISSVSKRSISNRCESRNFLSISLVSEIWFFSIFFFCVSFSQIFKTTHASRTLSATFSVWENWLILYFSFFLNEWHEICFFIYMN